MAEKDALLCPMCFRPMAFVMSVSKGLAADVILWKCAPCGHHVVQEGGGSRFPVTITTLPEEELAPLIISSRYSSGSAPQEFADSKLFFCPICRKELHETKPRVVTLTRDSGSRVRYRVELSVELSCPTCLPRPRHFRAVYCRGDTDIKLTETT